MQDKYFILINNLINEGYLRTPAIISAFEKIKRRDFIIEQYIDEYDVNTPLPIGSGQTISQPLTVAFMLELLQVNQGNKILDIGCGSGWTTALLAQITGKQGRVYGMEILPELCRFAEGNIKKYNFIADGNIRIICHDGRQGLPDHAPFDRIMVSAAAREIPPAFKDQLKVGGRLVIPVGETGNSQDIVLIEKKDKNKFVEQHYSGFVFVPLV